MKKKLITIILLAKDIPILSWHCSSRALSLASSARAHSCSTVLTSCTVLPRTFVHLNHVTASSSDDSSFLTLSWESRWGVLLGSFGWVGRPILISVVVSKLNVELASPWSCSPNRWWSVDVSTFEKRFSALLPCIWLHTLFGHCWYLSKSALSCLYCLRQVSGVHFLMTVNSDASKSCPLARYKIASLCPLTRPTWCWLFAFCDVLVGRYLGFLLAFCLSLCLCLDLAVDDHWLWNYLSSFLPRFIDWWGFAAGGLW